MSPPTDTTEQKPPVMSIVTTCKGRLHHLIQSLPTFLNQPATEVIVVDYDCPDKTANFLAANFPAVRTVRVADAGDFNLCKARNIGASSARAELLAFVDADILLSGDFAGEVARQIQPGHFGRFKGRVHGSYNATGTCVIPRSAFARVGGYDEVLAEIGGNDRDIYSRLKFSGTRQITLEPALIDRVILHGNEERTRFRTIKDVQLGRLITTCYRQLKNIVLRLEGRFDLDIEVRQGIYLFVKAEVQKHYGSGMDFNIVIDLPHDGAVAEFQEVDVSRMIGVKIRRKTTSPGGGPRR